MKTTRKSSALVWTRAASFAVLAATLAQPTHAQVASLTPSGAFSVYQTSAAQTPPMGWNPWNAFHTDVDEAKIRAVARTIVDSGLARKGYRFINIDDGWALRRLADGRLRIRDSMFPSAKIPASDTGSFKPFTDYIHSLGLKAGLYTDIGRNTCAQVWDANSPNLPVGTVAERQVGSFGHAAQDMRTMFADWRFDYVKIDACGVADYTRDVAPVKAGDYQAFAPLIVRGNIPESDPASVEKLYATLGDAVRRWGGEAAVLSICAWGEALSPLWGHVRGNLWRTSPDIEFTWKSMLGNIDSMVDGALYAGPGHWNDPDMLAIGHGDFDATHLVEARSHFTMWAIMASPLLLGYDVRKPAPALLDIVGNPEVIAIDQDAAGNQGVPYRDGDAMVVVRTLTSPGARAVAMFNRGTEPVTAQVRWEQLGFAPGSRATVRDVWARRNRATAAGTITAELPAHGAVLLRVEGTPADPDTVPLDEMPARVNIAVDGLSPATALPMGQFPARINTAPDGTPLSVNGKHFAKGIGLFANSRVELRASGQFHRFVATPLVLSGAQPVRFRVYADRKLVAETSVTPSLEPHAIDADVTGAKVVELVAEGPNDPRVRPAMIAWGAAGFKR
ncbi:NPCBM/NEW2 domain-containing protein [Sphingomonas panacis]|uniref:NPCBM/NEW2 domain-containing protein n=1 Tax=Sphingomonas panacis TaxID=1560345 RepID=UPI00084115F2|nr:NPCBM/NEW2 domain-containing protein [Sphingomonas panacis]